MSPGNVALPLRTLTVTVAGHKDRLGGQLRETQSRRRCRFACGARQGQSRCLRTGIPAAAESARIQAPPPPTSSLHWGLGARAARQRSRHGHGPAGGRPGTLARCRAGEDRRPQTTRSSLRRPGGPPRSPGCHPSTPAPAGGPGPSWEPGARAPIRTAGASGVVHDRVALPPLATGDMRRVRSRGVGVGIDVTASRDSLPVRR